MYSKRNQGEKETISIEYKHVSVKFCSQQA